MKPSLSGIFLVFIMVCCTPYANSRIAYDTTIKSGDVMPDSYLPMLSGKNVGLIINQTSKIGRESLLDVLIKHKVRVTKIFVPEHGFRGKEDAGAVVLNARDSATDIPVISLYGNNKKPQPEQLADVDVMVYDLQDVGVRFFTYISTLQYAMEACAENGKQFIVLDRPDPNGFYIDGPVLDTSLRSFVGMQPVPIVYGMTAGEYAKMIAGERWFHKAENLDLKVIPCINYDHTKKYRLPVSPSPNLRNMSAIFAYPSLCLFEGTAISVGRGTVEPFLQWGCPEFAGKFSYHFVPASGEGAKKPMYEGRECYGVSLGGNENSILMQIKGKIYIGWLIEAYQSYPDKGKFFNDFFTKLIGNQKFKQQLIENVSEDEIYHGWQKEIGVFKKVRKKYLLYKDFE